MLVKNIHFYLKLENYFESNNPYKIIIKQLNQYKNK